MTTQPPPRPAHQCPTCGKATAGEEHPFCSRRCADVDLGRWLNGAYAIPGDPADTEASVDELPE